MMKSSSVVRWWLIAAVIAVSTGGCSSAATPEPVAAPPALAERVLPVTMIEQELPLSLSESWQITTLALAQQDIPLAEVVEQEALIITEWLPMQDRLCTTVTAATTPMNCETQYRLSLFAAGEESSMLRIRYVEDCTADHQIYLRCPNSAAEKRMISIIGDIKALAGIR